MQKMNESFTLSKRSILTLLFKRKKAIFIFFSSVVVLAVVVSLLTAPVFRAEAKILIEREVDSGKALLLQMDLQQRFDNYDFINSEIEIINSYPVAESIAKNYNDFSKSVGSDSLDKKMTLEKMIRNIKRSMEVSHTKKSNVVRISYEEKNPKLAAKVVNEVIATYFEYRSELSKDSETYKFFQDQMDLADNKLRSLEKAQASFKEEYSLISPDAQRSMMLNRLSGYEESLTQVNTKRIGKEAKLAVIEKQIKKGYNISIPSTETSDSPSREKYIANIKGKLLDLETQKEQMLQKFTPEYEEVVNLDKQITANKAKIKDEIMQIIDLERASIRALRAEEEVLEASIDLIKKDIREFAQKEYKYTQLSRGIEDNREIYSMLLKQREEARISLAKVEKGVKIKVISPAVAPIDPVRPKKKLQVLIAIFLGTVGGIGLALVLEYFDHSITCPEDLEMHLGIHVLGSVRDIGLQEAETSVDDRDFKIMT